MTQTVDRLIALIVQIHDLLQGLDESQKGLVEKTGDETVATLTGILTVPALHVLDHIWSRGPTNGAAIVRSLGLTKGGVSKILKRLESLKLIDLYKEPTNSKEVVSSITDLGSRVATVHRKLHDGLLKESEDFLHRYDPKDLQMVLSFLEDMVHDSPLAARPSPRRQGPIA